MSTEANNNVNQPIYLTVSDWVKKHSWPPLGGLRHLIFYAETNGFKNVIRRCGRHVLINETAFFQWLDKQGSDEAQTTTINYKKTN